MNMAGVDDSEAKARWDDALTAAAMFAVDFVGLRGVAMRAPAGPVRDLWMGYLRSLLTPDAPVRRMPAGIEDDRLLGGVDLAGTLRCRRSVVQSGILVQANGGIIVTPMAERLNPATAARIASVLDRGEVVLEREGISQRLETQFGVIAFDEGENPDEQMPAALAQRLAFHLDLGGLSARGLTTQRSDIRQIQSARARLANVEQAADNIVVGLVRTAASFGIDSIVAPILALRAAQVAAALGERSRISAEDAILAARLVLAPRALSCPTDEQVGARQDAEEPGSAPQSSDHCEGDVSASEGLSNIEDVMRAAIQAALPSGLLGALKGRSSFRSKPTPQSGLGTAQASSSRGRPAGVRMGQMRSGARLAIVETLRAAAPWQTVRKAERVVRARSRRIEVRAEDFRIKKFVKRRESTIVFCVDASGSVAFHRLGEAKGAVELLLGEAYAARTFASLIAFRGQRAELLLPPSRSLTRAKSILSALPGGGGTPLSAGIEAAVQTAIAERAKGREPLIVLLTDGRANIANDGATARPRAFAEALMAAKTIAAQGLSAVFVDTSPRARLECEQLADSMAAKYVSLPHVEADRLRDIVREAAG